MALNDIELEQFKQILKKASKELGTKEIVYFSQWVDFFIGYTVEMNGVSLLKEYDLPNYWDRFGVDILDELVKKRFLVKTFELKVDPFEETVKYHILE